MMPAAETILQLSRPDDSQRRKLAAQPGILGHLLEILKSGFPACEEALVLCTRCISDLAIPDDVALDIGAKGGIPILVHLLQSSLPTVQQAAARALYSVCCRSGDLWAAAKGLGAKRLLTAMLVSADAGSAATARTLLDMLADR